MFSSNPSLLILMFFIVYELLLFFWGFSTQFIQSIVVTQVFSLLSWRLTFLLKLMVLIRILDMYILMSQVMNLSLTPIAKCDVFPFFSNCISNGQLNNVNQICFVTVYSLQNKFNKKSFFL